MEQKARTLIAIFTFDRAKNVAIFIYQIGQTGDRISNGSQDYNGYYNMQEFYTGEKW